MSNFTRRTCPITSDFVLAMRAEFGDEQVKVIAVREGEVRIGEVSEKRKDGEE